MVCLNVCCLSVRTDPSVVVLHSAQNAGQWRRPRAPPRKRENPIAEVGLSGLSVMQHMFPGSAMLASTAVTFNVGNVHCRLRQRDTAQGAGIGRSQGVSPSRSAMSGKGAGGPGACQRCVAGVEAERAPAADRIAFGPPRPEECCKTPVWSALEPLRGTHVHPPPARGPRRALQKANKKGKEEVLTV